MLTGAADRERIPAFRFSGVKSSWTTSALMVSPASRSTGEDRIYISGPFGFSTTASYLSRSEDHGQSFHLVPGNLAPYGKPLVTCVGGGDSAQAVDSVNRFYFADLQGLTDVSNSVSSDEGTTW